MSKFYQLRDPQSLLDNKYAWWSDSVKLEKIICPKSKGHQRAGNRITELFIRLPNNTDNIIWTWYSDCLIDDFAYRLLEENHITGYRLGKVNIDSDKRKGKKVSVNLYELIVIGSAGNIHPASGYKILEVCKECGAEKVQPFTKGLIVNNDMWDKSDIFTVKEYPKFILVTDKVKDLFERHEITGCVFIPVEQIKVDTKVY